MTLPLTSTNSRDYRIDSIDLLRGLVMIIMALDHTRDLFHSAAFTDDPLNLQTTTPALFMTRWITHLCAPVFVFLSGTSAFLQGLRKSKAALSAFLIKRGLWLLFVEVFIVSLAITFDITYSSTILQVIWAIGVSMIFLGVFVWLPFPVILAIGALIVFGHNALDAWEKVHQGPFPLWYSVLHVATVMPVTDDYTINVFYPVGPWIGVMMLGYCFGMIYKKYKDKSNAIAIYTGCSLIVLFVLLRWSNTYGDPRPWSAQKDPLYTFFSFINMQKYPPSLLYLCATLGPALIFLGAAGNIRNRVTSIITVYGRVPFLYYILHFYLLHLISAVMYILRGHTIAEGARGVPGIPLRFIAPGEGYGLAIVYLIWILIVILLYPVCKWFAAFKRGNRHPALSYL